MPEKDITRRAVERAVDIAAGVVTRIKTEVMPIGPASVRMSPKELKGALATASPETRRDILSRLSPDELRTLIN